jgi:hypothetical protein
MSNRTLRDLHLRLDGLERSNRRWKGAALIGLAMLTLGWALPAEDTVRAEAFELIDPQGNVRAELMLEDSNPELHLLDEDGVRRASLVHDAQQTGLFLQDAEGDTRVGAAHFAHGGGGYALHGPGGEGALVLYLRETGTLTHYGPDGEVVARFPERGEAGR